MPIRRFGHFKEHPWTSRLWRMSSVEKCNTWHGPQTTREHLALHYRSRRKHLLDISRISHASINKSAPVTDFIEKVCLWRLWKQFQALSPGRNRDGRHM